MNYKIISFFSVDLLNHAERDFFEEILKQEQLQHYNLKDSFFNIMRSKSRSNLSVLNSFDNLIVSEKDVQSTSDDDVNFGINPDQLLDLF